MGKHILTITDKETGAILRRYEYTSKPTEPRFMWEKVKQEQLTKVLRARDITADSVKVAEETM